MRLTAALFAFALVMPTISSMGQDAGGSSATPQNEAHLNPQDVSRPSNPKPDYSAESLVVERMDTIYRYGENGIGSREISAINLVQSDATARQYGVLTIPFTGNSQRVEVDYVRVRKPDGSLVETPAADAQEMPQEVTRQAPFYSDLKEKQIPVRNLQVGDRLEYKVRILDTKAEVPGEFWGQETFGSSAVILNQSVELRVPKATYVKVWSPEHPATRTETADEVVYRWTGSHLEPTVGKDGKAVQREIDPKGELPTMAWTTFKSWEAVGAWYRELEADRIRPNETIRAKVSELTAGKPSEAEKAQALYSFVATQIRYIGVAFGVWRYQPHPASEVLRNQYGDCKDKHTLLAAMLSSAGLHPQAALIGAGIRMNEEVPSPAAFNHMITFLPTAGTPIWLDSTSELAPYRMLVSPIRDKQALVVPAMGTARMERTPVGLPFQSFSKFTAKGTLTKDGTMKAQIELTERGDDELMMRTLLRQVPRGQWNELIQRLSQGLGFGGTTSSPDASRPDLTADPVKLTYSYEREKTGDWDNHRIVPLFPVVFLSSVDDKNPPKKVPIQLGEPRVETSVSIIQLPDGWGVELPAAVHQKSSFAAFDKTYKIEGETLTTERRIEVLQREIPAADWKSYKKWFDATLGDGESFIQLIGTPQNKSSTAQGSDDAAKLVHEAYEQVQRGELNSAEATLDKAKKINEKQQSLWSTYGYINFQRHNWANAIEAYKKDIALNPDTLWVYNAMAQAQMNTAHFDDAIKTLRALNRQNGATDDDRKLFAAVLTFRGQYDEALPIVESLAVKSPEDLRLQIEFGGVQLRSGQTAAGEKTIASALAKTSDPSLLNNGADELANAGIDLELAEKSARKAVDALTADSKEWRLDATEEDAKKVQGKQALLIAAWDTLGWTLYREGRLDESQSYLQASWNNSQSAEVGLHWGELAEKRGQKQEALHRYTLAFATTRDAMPEGAPTKGPDLISTELRKRIDILKKHGLTNSVNMQGELTKQRAIHVGSRAGQNLTLEYSFLIEKGRVTLVSRSASGQSSADEDAMVKRANLVGWIPQDSDAHLLRKGFLNCHSGTCELIVYPM
ncbi:DUF3857 domain-containing protein [Edaphobacter modestus]|uniref:Tetratricopeptide repeat protein n=1 Tax=Edaphobacter modestus TaxID=388466 RepID=A0A4Q7YXQ6_9BACT|nr:DUF3857 domain-containing protein [Edaphobacter modestus]RZU41879.1 tetratricopeptide repeat protein [Edaphobacter modestus]